MYAQLNLDSILVEPPIGLLQRHFGLGTKINLSKKVMGNDIIIFLMSVLGNEQ